MMWGRMVRSSQHPLRYPLPSIPSEAEESRQWGLSLGTHPPHVECEYMFMNVSKPHISLSRVEDKQGFRCLFQFSVEPPLCI